MKTAKMSFRIRQPRVRNLIFSSFSFVIANPLKRMTQSLFLSFQTITLSFLTRIRGLNIQQESRLFLSLRGHAVTAAIFLLTFLALPSSAFAEEKIPVFPTTPVEAYTVYGSLALFWLAIIFLIIVIKMKLNEIERIQKLGIDEEDTDAPILE